jgi:pimeloyl-ACP methyl ester carboxylesterase
LNTYILIHGAWHGGWCWEKIAHALRKDGHTVLTPDLPGHGDDTTRPEHVSLQAYTDRVVGLLDQQKEPVILVGHSMGGLVISQAAELRGDKIHTLVYVCAFLLRNGETLGEIAQRDTNALVMPNLVVTEDSISASLKPEIIRETFYANCSPEDANRAQSRLVPQALAPFGTPLQISEENFERVPRVYVECTRDRAISVGIQKEMCANTPCERTFALETDHSPFLSTPDELSSLLTNLHRG